MTIIKFTGESIDEKACKDTGCGGRPGTERRTVTMNRLRSKIEDEAHPYIKTVRGMGYIWTGGRA